jgi:hypothetical protein
VAPEIIMVVKYEDTCLRHRPTVEPGRRQPTNAAPNYNEVVAFLDWCAIDGKYQVLERKRMRRLERSHVMAAQTRERGRIVRRLCGYLRLRRYAGGDG